MLNYKANTLKQTSSPNTSINISIFDKVNLIYKIGSIAFDNKLKDIFGSNYYSLYKDTYSELEIQKLFTFWFIVNKIKQIIDSKILKNDVIIISHFNITLQKKYLNSMKSKIYSKENKVTKIIANNLTNYLLILFNISKDKNKTSIEEKLEEIDEGKIFDSDFFELHNIMRKSIKTNVIIHSNNALNLLNKQNHSKPEILFFKQLYSIIKNDCQFSFQITQKNRKK